MVRNFIPDNVRDYPAVPVFLINLERHKRQLQAAINELQKAALDQKVYVSGVDWMTTDRVAYLNEHGLHHTFLYQNTARNVGRLLSHRHMWEKVIEKDYPYALVVEDSVRIETAVVRRVIAECMDKIASGWDMITLDGGEDVLGGAYLVSSEGAQRLLDATTGFHPDIVFNITLIRGPVVFRSSDDDQGNGRTVLNKRQWIFAHIGGYCAPKEQ